MDRVPSPLEQRGSQIGCPLAEHFSSPHRLRQGKSYGKITAPRRLRLDLRLILLRNRDLQRLLEQ